MITTKLYVKIFNLQRTYGNCLFKLSRDIKLPSCSRTVVCGEKPEMLRDCNVTYKDYSMSLIQKLFTQISMVSSKMLPYQFLQNILCVYI